LARFQGNENAAAVVINSSHWLDHKSGLAHTLLSNKLLQTAFTSENPNVIWNGPFHEVLGLHWFQRIWVVQEAVLARKLLVNLGKEIIPDIFASASLRFMSLAPASEVVDKCIEDCYQICRGRHFHDVTESGLSMIFLILSLREWMQISNQPIHPSELVFLCKDRKASNPCNKIYGVTGFFDIKRSLIVSPSLPANYLLPTSELYKQFTCWCIAREGNLDVLAQQRNEGGRNRLSQLPSWATGQNRKGMVFKMVFKQQK